MTQTKLVKLRVKPGQKQAWLNWTEELKRRRAEVLNTLRNEGVVSESCYISEDGESVFYFMEADDFAKAKLAISTKPHQIDHDHRQAREVSLEFVERLDCLFHFAHRD